VQSTPPVKGFRPFGRLAGKRDSVVLTLDEYEAIRLLDYEHHTQEEAAVQMRVSRPTLTRIYERARIKYATALVEGCLLLIGGGDVKLRRHSYLCQDCGTELESPEQSLTDCRAALHPAWCLWTTATNPSAAVAANAATDKDAEGTDPEITKPNNKEYK